MFFCSILCSSDIIAAITIVKFEECLQLDELNANYNSTILLNIAICYSKLNKNDLALKALNKAILYNPKYAKAYVKRGEIHL
jgi:tetratricopeptide (TPR) repeat protein